VVPGRGELPRVSRVGYRAFCDPSGGSADSMVLCVGHAEENAGKRVAVIDCIRERRPPFDPDSVVREFAEVLRSYGLREVVGDRYGGDWPSSRFAAHQISYVPSEQTKAQIYVSALPLMNARRVELPDHPRLVAQFCALERRVGRGTGREIVDHPVRGHDDLCNVVAGVATLVAGKPSGLEIWAACAGAGAQRQLRRRLAGVNIREMV
jgi:hypothetical protein